MEVSWQGISVEISCTRPFVIGGDGRQCTEMQSPIPEIVQNVLSCLELEEFNGHPSPYPSPASIPDPRG